MTTFQGQSNKMLGRFTGSLSLASVTRSLATGLYTVDGVISGDLHTSGSLKDFQYKDRDNLIDQSPSDVYYEDMVAESGGYDITVVEMRLAGYIPLTEQLRFGGYTYARLQRNFFPPGATNPFIYLAIAKIEEFDGGSIEKGTMECTMTFKSSSVPPYVSNGSGSLPY